MSEPVVDLNNASIIENITETSSNGTTKEPSTPEGMALAYGSLVFMALLPIFVGSFRSVTYQTQQRESGEQVDIMSSQDACKFPVIASCSLGGLYLLFSVFPKEYINFLFASFFFILGISVLYRLLSPAINKIVPASLPFRSYHLLFTEEIPPSGKETILEFLCSTHDFLAMGVCSLFAVWYLVKKHWIANNILGVAFAINGVELLQLNSYITGALLLSGLFLYDIFWVFGTDVMVFVAKSLDAPIKLVFPQDILSKGFAASNFAMLGLGDIVIPGIFIALLLRFDRSLNRGTNTYFNATFAAYIAGLGATIFVMHVFKHAQPALLYLVPMCLGTPSLLALVKGDIRALIKYEDNPNNPNEEQQATESTSETSDETKKND